MVEVILAISLVGLVVLFLLGLLPSTGLLTREAEHQLSATQFAKEIDAHLGSLAFQTVRGAAPASLTVDSPAFLAGTLVPRRLSDSTTLEPTVELPPAPPDDKLVQAAIVIRWKVGERDKSYRLVKRYSAIVR